MCIWQSSFLNFMWNVFYAVILVWHTNIWQQHIKSTDWKILVPSFIVDKIKWTLHQTIKINLHIYHIALIWSYFLCLVFFYHSAHTHTVNRLFVWIQLILIKFIFIEKYHNYFLPFALLHLLNEWRWRRRNLTSL